MRKIISLMLMMTLSLPALTACTASADQRTGEAEGYGGTLKVSVTMNGTDITDVKVTEHNETQGVGTRAIDTLPEAIVEADSVQVDSVSGATVTSEAIKEAVSQAIGLSGIIQDVIPINENNAVQAKQAANLTGVGMASTGRVGPGKGADGSQVYSFNVVFAAGSFDPNGAIRSMQVDQLEIVTPNLGGGSTFSGVPQEAAGEDAFLQEVSSWQTKGMMGEGYKLQSGTWREQMDAYQKLMVGKTVEEVKTWYQNRGDASSESNATNAADTGTAQPMNDMANVPSADAISAATMSLQGEYGDILLAIERAWEDAQRHQQGGTKVDTNTVTDTTESEAALG